MKNYKININETTSSNGSRGSFSSPLVPGVREFDDVNLEPFTIPVSKYNNAMLEYDSYDGKMDTPKKKIKKIEDKSKKMSDYIKKHPQLNDDDGGVVNQFPNKNKKGIVPVKEWIEITDDLLMEDLAVWFGTKKKPKGSSQPKGPWVNICRKVDGKHPPCGRPEAKSDSYPKCRASGVAGKMSDSEKRSACQQKRRAEKSHDKSGTGNKPKMVSYKKKPTNESIERLINRILNHIL